MKFGFCEPFDHLDFSPIMQILFVHANFVNCDILGEVLEYKAGLWCGGQYIYNETVIAGEFPEHAQMRLAGSATNRRKLIIEH